MDAKQRHNLTWEQMFYNKYKFIPIHIIKPEIK